MKKLIALLLLLLLLPVAAGAGTVVTSFYPVWLFTLNLTDGIPDLNVKNLASPDTGCLHDYQLSTGDLKTLSGADVFLINGAGMETYLDHVFSAFPDLPVVSAADGIPLLNDSSSLQIGETEDADMPNAHIWLDASNAAAMVRNLAEGLIRVMPEYEAVIRTNAENYTARLLQLDSTLKDSLSSLPHTDIVTFHEAFPYFAKAYGLTVAAVVNREPGETLTPAQMARLADVVGQLGNPPLFVEPQYDDLSARILAAETGAPVYSLDPIVTGPESDVPSDYYETVMLRNMAVLCEALGN